MRRRRARIAALGAAFGVVLVAGVAWANLRSIDARFTNRIGAPTETAPAAIVDLDDPPVLRLAAAGDVGTGGDEEFRTAAAMDVLDEQSPFDALLLLGDNIYPSGDPSQVQARVFTPFESVLDGGTRLLAVLGNHDVKDNNGAAQAEALGMPHRWYSTRLGDTVIISLDSTQPENPEQTAWLEQTLAASDARWTIVTLHHPAYSAGWHGSESGVREHFVPLFETYQVDLVLSGHEHDYQRSTDINGVTYVVTGAAAKLRPTGQEDFTAVSWSTHSFVDLAVFPDRIEGQAIDHDGRAIDSFVLVR